MAGRRGRRDGGTSQSRDREGVDKGKGNKGTRERTGCTYITGVFALTRRFRYTQNMDRPILSRTRLALALREMWHTNRGSAFDEHDIFFYPSSDVGHSSSQSR